MDRIWYIDDEEMNFRLDHKRLVDAFPAAEIRYFATCEDGLAEAKQARPDVVVLDELFADSEMQGHDFLPAFHAIHRRVGVVMVTANPSVDLAVSMMRMGASDFLPKPFKPQELLDALHRALAERKLDRRAEVLEEGPRATEASFDGLVGTTGVMRELIRRAEVVAQTDATVLITGETGTGKGLLAKYIHEISARSGRPFVNANVAVTTEQVLESALFGHEPGAFTGAGSRRLGKFDVAEGGTIFLDEIGDFSSAAQLKLLRVLQEGTFERMGSEQSREADVRVIAATNRDLGEMLERGVFREDLYYRLRVCHLQSPPLRHRMEDLEALVQHLIVRFNEEYGRVVRRVNPDVMRRWREYRWPGNLRELAARVAEAVIHSAGEEIGPESMWPEAPPEDDHVEMRLHNLVGDRPLGEATRLVQRSLVFPALESTRKKNGDWNISAATKRLGMSITAMNDFLVREFVRGSLASVDLMDHDACAEAIAKSNGISSAQAASLVNHGASRGHFPKV